MSAIAQYERVHAVEDDHWWFVGLRELVVETLRGRLGPGARVLDAGCGTGRVLADMPPGWDRVGLDSNPDVLEIARRREGIEWVEGSVQELPFEDASFDAVISLDVLSDARVADPLRAATELRRVLRPGGVLVLNLPAYRWLMSGHDLVARTGRRYTARVVARMLDGLGFGERRVTYRMTALFPIAAARRLANRGAATTDVGTVAGPINAVLTRLLRLENRLLGRLRLPLGLSVFAIATITPVPGQRLKGRLLANRRLVGLVQFAVTGERVPRRHRLLAEEIRRGAHDVVLDLGCGAAPLLDFVSPGRYVGIDEHAPSLEAGRRRRGGPGREFVEASLADAPLKRWRGADAVIVSSVCHHLSDAEVRNLVERIQRDVAPGRILVQDAEATGPLGPLVAALDEGDHLRPSAELARLLEPGFETRLRWTYDNPLRSFHQYLLELVPRERA